MAPKKHCQCTAAIVTYDGRVIKNIINPPVTLTWDAVLVVERVNGKLVRKRDAFSLSQGDTIDDATLARLVAMRSARAKALWSNED